MVHEFDRLGRNKKLTLEELQYFKDNGIRLVALNLPTTQLDTTDNVMLETINNIVIGYANIPKFNVYPKALI